MHILVTRPAADAVALKARLIEQGHVVTVEPLISIEHEPVAESDILGAQALIATSRNGVRSVGRSAAIDVARSIPLFAVGPGTTATARALGFEHVIQGPRTARDLVKVITGLAEVNAGPLVHLAGDHLAYDVAGELRRLGFHVHQPVVYRSVPAERFSERVAVDIAGRRIEGVILLSPQTARIYVALIRRHGILDASRILMHFCLSPAVAAALSPLGSLRTITAREPNLEELLAVTGADAAR